MPATTGEKVGVFIIAFLMIISVVGGAGLYFLSDDAAKKEIENRDKELAEYEKEQAFLSECQKVADKTTNKESDAPKVYTTEDEVKDLQITDIKEGDGKTVEDGDCVVINYHGNLAKGGEIFDSSYLPRTEGQETHPFAAIIGPDATLIEGWKQGIPGMKVGGERRLVIPADLAYGEKGTTTDPYTGELRKSTKDTEKDIDPTKAVDEDEDGRVDYIPENAALVFEVKLIDVMKYSDWEPTYQPTEEQSQN